MRGGGSLVSMHVTAFALRLAFSPACRSLLSTFSGPCFSDVCGCVWVCVGVFVGLDV
jgi:hypothetical protein